MGRVEYWRGKADTAEHGRLAAELKARTDSIALIAMHDSVAIVTVQLTAARVLAHKRELGARLNAERYSDAVRHIMDSVNVSTESLDSLEHAHTTQIEALQDQIALADSINTSIIGVWQATDTALRSERAVVIEMRKEMDALHGRISALNAKRHIDKLQKAALAVIVFSLVVK
jgi:hypothetical protein